MKYVPPLGAVDPEAPYVDANPDAGTEGSPVGAKVFEQPQREIVNLILALGLTPTEDNVTQLATALAAGKFLNIGALTDHAGAAPDDAEVAILTGGQHKRATVAELFTGRAGLDQIARDMAMVTAFQQFISGNVAAGTFADWARVNTFPADNLPTKTGATYDATNKLYHNPGGPVLIAGGARSGNYTSGSGLAALSDGNTSQTLQQGAYCTSSPGFYSVDHGDGVSKTVTQFKVWVPTDGARGGGNGEMSGTFRLLGSADNSNWTELYSGSHQCLYGAAITVSSPAINTTTAYRHHKIETSGITLNFGFAEIQFFEGGDPSDMTLIDTAYAVPSAPLDGRAFLLHKFTSGGVLNTDIKAFMASDGSGAGGWVQGTLSLQDASAFNTGFDLLVADFDLSGLPAGTSPLLKVQTFNTVSQQVRALGSIAS